MSKAALIVVFNHKYEKNIPKLDAYYSDRFSYIRYLMPFGSGDDPRSIRVVENGHCFSGHIAQGLQHYKAEEVTHYVFVGDDLILNPSLTEANLVEALGLPAQTAYIKSLSSADEARFRWPWAIYGYKALQSAKFNYAAELPPPAEARARFEQLGIRFSKPYPKTRRDVTWLEFPGKHRKLRELHWNLKFIRPYFVNLADFISSMGKPSDYPLLAGYSDFVVVPAGDIDAFAHYCGVFAATNMFAELAVPTALALACQSIQTELQTGDHFCDPRARRADTSTMRGVELWASDIEKFCNEYRFSWQKLMDQYPRDVLYYHPVKLSMWK